MPYRQVLLDFQFKNLWPENVSVISVLAGFQNITIYVNITKEGKVSQKNKKCKYLDFESERK